MTNPTPPAPPPLLILCDWIPPAFGAVGQYEMIRAQEAARSGRRVVLVGFGDRQAPRGLSVADVAQQARRGPLDSGGLSLVRLRTRPARKSSIFQRAAWALMMNWRLLRAGVTIARSMPQAEVKVTGSPPFFAYFYLAWTRMLGPRRRVIYRISDFYPETAFVAGHGVWLKPLTGVFHALRRSADQIDALSNCQVRRLIESGVPEDRIRLERDASPIEVSATTPAAARPFGEGELILLYSGNLGVAHEWGTFAEGYRRHVREGSNHVRLWLNATGVGAPKLEDFCRQHGLPVHRSGPSSLDELPGVLMAADAHLIVLREQFWGYVFPSKTYACLQTGRPILYVGPSESDVHSLLGGAERPLLHASIRNGDPDGVRRALDGLRA